MTGTTSAPLLRKEYGLGPMVALSWGDDLKVHFGSRMFGDLWCDDHYERDYDVQIDSELDEATNVAFTDVCEYCIRAAFDE